VTANIMCVSVATIEGTGSYFSHQISDSLVQSRVHSKQIVILSKLSQTEFP